MRLRSVMRPMCSKRKGMLPPMIPNATSMTDWTMDVGNPTSQNPSQTGRVHLSVNRLVRSPGWMAVASWWKIILAARAAMAILNWWIGHTLRGRLGTKLALLSLGSYCTFLPRCDCTSSVRTLLQNVDQICLSTSEPTATVCRTL